MLITTVPIRHKSDLAHLPLSAEHWTELRLDYLNSSEEILSLIADIPHNDHLILTLRTHSEGGNWRGSDTDKQHIIQSILESTHCLIDIEFRFLSSYPLPIPKERLLLSLHTSLDNEEEIECFLQTDIEAAWYKLAVSGSLPAFQALTHRIQTTRSLLLIPLPPLPAVLRLLYPLYGSAGTYVHSGEAVVPNQLPLSVALQVNSHRLTAKTRIYGIIGSKQVYHSLSFRLYNQYFQSWDMDAVYLPLAIDHADEIPPLLDYLSALAPLVGFAITMPFKQSLPSLLGREVIANTWLPETHDLWNTDIYALQAGVNRLIPDRQASICVYGSGAMARLTLTILRELDYKNLFTLSRKHPQLHSLASPDAEVSPFVCDLLINCTPYGILDTDNPEDLPPFLALIDLPYCSHITTLVGKAQSLSLPYVDGKEFWLLQSVEQAKLFGLPGEFGEFAATHL